jgi:hypothetical protein
MSNTADVLYEIRIVYPSWPHGFTAWVHSYFVFFFFCVLFYCFVLCVWFFFCLLYVLFPLLVVSLDCPYIIAPSVFSNAYLLWNTTKSPNRSYHVPFMRNTAKVKMSRLA